jgi:hypothetical protein
MADELFVNDPSTTLSAAITSSGATSISVTSATGFPASGNFRILIDSELMLVTAVSGTTFTVTRGIEGTAAVTHTNTTPVHMEISAGGLLQVFAELNRSGPYASLPAARRAGGLYLFEDSLYQFARDNGSSWDHFVQGKKVSPPGGFTTQNASSSVLTTTNGGESLLSAVGAGGNNVTGRYVAYPTAPFTRTFCLQMTPARVNGSGNPDNGTAGIYLSDGTAVEYFGIYGVSMLAIQFGPSVTNITTNVITPRYTTFFNNILWLRIDDGVNTAGQRTFWYSFDGVNFFQFWQESNTANLTPTRLGFFAQAFDTSTFSNVWCLGYQ